MSHFSEEAVICQRYLWPDVDDLSISEDHAAIVEAAPVNYWHPTIDDDILTVFILDKFFQHLPAVFTGVFFQVMIQAIVA